MLRTDWDEITVYYNNIFGTEFTKPAAMMRACYKKFGNLEEAALKLGISAETLRLQMIKNGNNIVPQGKWKRGKC